MTHGLLQPGLPLAIVLGLFARAALIRRSLIRLALHAMRSFGLFHLARYMTRDGLRIICYHGFALEDEYKFRGTLFIKNDLFRRRLEYLKTYGYPVLPLSKALEALSASRLQPCATVITMDDGWRGIYTRGLPIIQELQIPVTVYVATYYIENPMPVYTVTLSYLFWRAPARCVNLPRELGMFDLNLQGAEAEEAAQKFGDTLLPSDRLAFLRELADILGVPFDDIETQHLFRLMDEQQLRELDAAGVDIQLHSHTHRWPLYDKGTVENEIAMNRRCLQRIVSHPLDHFCYPSGVHGLHQGEWLAALGVKSATTIEPGFNYGDTPRFALRRIVDGGAVSDIEFAAEISGFMEILRSFRGKRLGSTLRSHFSTILGSQRSNAATK
jgi:peptidoglycan/xylan/chitin deacetylase (PgdA/CDA1 family)